MTLWKKCHELVFGNLKIIKPVCRGRPKRFLTTKGTKKLGVGCRPQPIFLSTENTESAEIFCRVAALTDGMAREFVIWSIGFSD